MKRRALLAALILTFAAGAAVAEEKAVKKTTGGESFIPLGGMSATADKGGGRRGVLTVQCGLDIPDEKLRTLAQMSIPRLRAAYVQKLQIYAAGLAPAEPPDPDFISRELQRQTDAVLGRPGARFLLGSIILN